MKTIKTFSALLFLLLFASCASSEPFSYGESRTIKSEILGKEKAIQVHLPSDTGHPNQKFPVLYLLHGQWDMLAAMATLDLIATTVPDFMVVGIDSLGAELDVKEDEDKFAAFLERELFSFIEREYPAADFRILSGHSHAGKYVMQQWLMDTLPVSRYFAFSPSLDDGYILDKVQTLPKDTLGKHKPLLLTMASEGEHMYAPYAKLDAILTAALPKQYSSRHFPEETHRSTKHPSMKFALQASFPEWAPSREVMMSGAAAFKQHYNTLTARYGLSALPSVEMLQQLTARYSVADSTELQAQLEPMFDYALHDLRLSPTPFVEIVDYLTDNGYAQASELYLAALCQTDESIARCKPGATKP
ncbi:alpha/beta hydrolase [Microbulbifer pacificus]|uniref:Alpha/beta hydrolase-fold protein n=1 Tax=Microbulbifer pacificus TaxID=407164 RepID=A0AAU0MX21_9GAMM|nr:alpha/beta hydrolase-fold protein [Microbulbifer pacificus]WOX04406.1 alpha/beta hydrolase-fold protein [Microbulbifer pacificus]